MADRRPQRVSPEVGLAVWEAEDGRCEACGRPMDRSCTRFTRLDHTRADWSADNLQLLCVDCDRRRPDLLTHLVLAGEVAERVVGGLGPEQAEQATRWLRAALRKHGVLVWARAQARAYWLPGIATFRVVAQADGTAAAVVAVTRLAPQPQLKLKPQARTRGLPRPDRRPLLARGPKTAPDHRPRVGAGTSAAPAVSSPAAAPTTAAAADGA